MRRFFTTVAAIAQGIANTAMRRYAEPAVELKAGDRAPAFALTGSDGRTYRLSDYDGRSAVVIAWFPKAFTGGCTAECRSLAAHRNVLRRFGVEYFAASVDDPATNAEFAASLGLDYPILSDPTRATAQAYGVLGTSGFPERWTFFIGRDGRVLTVDRQVSTATHGADIAGQLQALGVQERT